MNFNAIKVYYSMDNAQPNKVAQKLTKEQAVIISAYTGFLACSFSDLQEYAQKLMGRPIWTHEFADPVVADKIRELSKQDFLAICHQ